MLSYRHAFHAGNHADVLKHVVLLHLLEYLGRKDKPFWVIDTHAGAGMYALDQGYAQKNAEFMDGIARLYDRDDLPGALRDYVALVRSFNPSGVLQAYPGSPLIARSRLRTDDRLRLFELHPADHAVLQQHIAGDRKIRAEQIDGLSGLRALLPPPPRRGLVLIDPSYEDKQDYVRVPQTVRDALRRFATGIYVVWYPLLSRTDPLRMVESLKRLGEDWLDVRLQVCRPAADGFGMYGSGMFVLHPPWTLEAGLRAVMPCLARVLGQDAGAGFTIDAQTG